MNKNNKNSNKYPTSKFVKKVIFYLESEWGIFFEKQNQDVQNQIVIFVHKMQHQGNNVPNIAAEIASSIVPL